MPTYSYECLECGKNFDIFQSITAKPLKKCIECKGEVRRLIGAGAGVIFKGSGFYHTDYKKNQIKKDTKCPASSGDKSACEKCPNK